MPRLVAQVCDIVLTSRPVGKDQRVPLAGVPYHSVEGYIAKLIQAGHKVAIVEQIGEVPAKGLVDREVVRVVTPGTVVEPSLLDERRNNYLAALVVDGNRAGLAYADITTGEFAATQLAGERRGRAWSPKRSAGCSRPKLSPRNPGVRREKGNKLRLAAG